MIDRDLVTEITKQRYEIADLIHEAQGIRKNKLNVQTIQALLKTLKQRQIKLKQMIDSFDNALAVMKKDFPQEQDFLGAPPNTEQYLTEGKLEERELREVISDGEDYLHSARYDRALTLLRPYEDGISYLPVLSNVWKKLEKTMSPKPQNAGR